MKKIEIVATFGKYKKGQVVEMGDFEVGHALAFNYGRLYAPTPKPIETQMVEQPETRCIDHVEEIEVEQPQPIQEEKKTFFKRRGRRSKKA